VQYELQRSINSGGSFETILIKAGLGAGNAQTAHDDAPPAQPGDTVQYRVKWRTLDGTQFFTSVRRVPWTAANVIAAVYPNPTDGGAVNIRWSAEPGKELNIVVTDAVGRLVYRSSLAPGAFDNETRIQLPVARGMYYLRAELNGNKLGEKIIVR
jgi:hypothetical protein